MTSLSQGRSGAQEGEEEAAWFRFTCSVLQVVHLLTRERLATQFTGQSQNQRDLLIQLNNFQTRGPSLRELCNQKDPRVQFKFS